MEKTLYNSKTRIALVIVLAVILAISAGLCIYLTVAPNQFASAKEPDLSNVGFSFNVETKVMRFTPSPSVASWSFTLKDGSAKSYLSESYLENSVVEFDLSNYFADGTLKYNTDYNVSITCLLYAGTNASANHVIKVVSLPVAPTKTGYTFTGWYTDEACTQLYDKDTVTSDVTLYAGFRPNNYTIVFNGNGSTSGSMSNLAMKYDTAKNLTANAFAKTGYKFSGWATSTNGAVVYTDKQSVNNLTADDGATINLYAHWTLVEYHVHFNGNGNTSGSMANQTLVKDIAATLTANAFVKTGYHFTGWATSANGSVVYTDKKSVTNIGDPGSTVELYAVWAANTYRIVFHNGATDATGSMTAQNLTYDTSTTIKENAFSRVGYTFVGWATSEDGTAVYTDAEEILNLTAENGKEIHLYAVWEIIHCKVTFMVDGEVFVVVSVDYGTPSDEVIGRAVNPTMYVVDGTLPN